VHPFMVMRFQSSHPQPHKNGRRGGPRRPAAGLFQVFSARSYDGDGVTMNRMRACPAAHHAVLTNLVQLHIQRSLAH